MNIKALLAALVVCAGLSPALDKHVEELLRTAETLRGLQAKHSVPAEIIDEKDLPARIAEMLREELPQEQLRSAEAALKTFGLLPQSLDLAAYYPALLGSQVAGYYDPERRNLTVVRRGDREVSRPMEDLVLVHELTHALQDQTFDLRRFVQGDPLSDEDTARTALVEGDASLVMFDFFEKEEGDPADLADLAAAQADTREMAAAPPWLRGTLEFGYVDGYLFCRSVRQKGGQKLLDSAFREDPPRSSEQILHPEKWHTKRDDPIPLPWPDLTARLPGLRKLAEGQLGELGIGILLRGTRGGASSDAAAAGWGGDRFAVYEKGERRLLAWLTAWDSAADAQEFQAAARWLGRGWKIEPSVPRRVIVLRGPWTRTEARVVRAALAAVQ